MRRWPPVLGGIAALLIPGILIAQIHTNPTPGDVWTYFGPTLGGGWGAPSGGGSGSPGGTTGQLQWNNAGSFAGVTVGGDFSINTTTGVGNLANTGVAAGSYINTNITVDTKGRVTAAASGTGGGTGANPTATAGPTAVNGVATTFLRSDGAPAIQKGTNAQFGIVEGDGSTITCVAGVCTAIGGSATSIVPGTTTIGGATAPCLIENSTGTTMACAAVGTGVVTALGVAANATGGAALVTPTTSHGDSAYAILTSDRYVVTNANFTAPRTWTLPAISASLDGVEITVADDAGNVSATNSLAITPNGTDTVEGVNNASASTIAVARGSFTLKANNATKNWKAIANTIQQAYTCTNSKFASAQSATGVTTCTSLPGFPIAIGWLATVNPNNAIIANINQASTVTSIVGSVETPTGTAATVTVNKAASGTACSAGTALHSGTFNANGTAATNQTLTVTTSSLAPGDRLCLQTTGTTAWTGGTGAGGITVFVSPS